MADRLVVSRADGARNDQTHRLESLTGLRFLAALAVFGFHLRQGVGGHRLGILDRPLSAGLVGVSFFFVLSGFVLAWSARPGDGAAAFWRRRVARVVPAHVVAWGLGLALVATTSATATVGQAVASLLLVQAWSSDLDVVFAVNLVTWSLACEAFFYLVFPVLLPALRRFTAAHRRVLALALVVLVVAWAEAAGTPESDPTAFWRVYLFPVARLPEFVLGVLLALELREGRAPRVPVAPVALLALGAWVGASWLPVRFLVVAATLVPFALLILAVAQHDLAGRRSALRTRAFVRLGAWSYAFYLLHTIVQRAFVHHEPLLWPDLPVAVPAAVLLALSLAGAALLYALVEHPLERLLRGGR